MREIEVQISISVDIIIGTDINKKTPCPIPTSLQLIKQNEVVNPLTVCHHRGNTYLGSSNGSLVRINTDDNVTPFISCRRIIISIRAKDNRLFVLLNGNPHTVCVYDLNGKIITSWNHTDLNDGYYHGSNLVLRKDQVVKAERKNQQIMIYSDSGNKEKQIPCPNIRANNWSTMCEAGQDHIIFTNYHQSNVFKLNLTSGEVEWTCTEIPRPEGVACYGRDYVIVHNYTGPERIWILNQKTGKSVDKANSVPLLLKWL